MRLTQRGAVRWPLLAAAGVVVLIAAGAATMAVASKRHARVRAAADASRAAVTDARAADTRTWAPDELLAAERAWREAQAVQRLDESALWPLPDAARLVAAHAAAEQAARSAIGIAGQRRAGAAATAQAHIAEASAAVSATGTRAANIHMGPDRLRLLARARAALHEAGVYDRAGDFATASVRARHAFDLAGQVDEHAAAVAARYADAETLARWRRWRDETIAWSRRENRAAIVVAKEPRTLTVFVRGEAVKTYRIDLGFNWIADKLHAGDGATPEGRYRVVTRKANGQSIYYKALLLDYPNAEDRAEYAQARRAGLVPPATGIGSLIEIHGDGGRGVDWTRGCVAMTNPDIDDLWGRVAVGTPVTIVGSDNYGALAEFAVQRRSGSGSRRP